MKKVILTLAMIMAMTAVVFSFTACKSTTSYTYDSCELASSTIPDAATNAQIEDSFKSSIDASYEGLTISIGKDTYTIKQGKSTSKGELTRKGGKIYFDEEYVAGAKSAFQSIGVTKLELYLEEKSSKLTMVMEMSISGVDIVFHVNFVKA